MKPVECYLLVCGDCGYIDDGPGYVEHFSTAAEALAHAVDIDWLVTEDAVYCADCRGKYEPEEDEDD